MHYCPKAVNLNAFRSRSGEQVRSVFSAQGNFRSTALCLYRAYSDTASSSNKDVEEACDWGLELGPGRNGPASADALPLVRRKRKRHRIVKKVVEGDLDATLEAQRRANRASLIRRVAVNSRVSHESPTEHSNRNVLDKPGTPYFSVTLEERVGDEAKGGTVSAPQEKATRSPKLMLQRTPVKESARAKSDPVQLVEQWTLPKEIKNRVLVRPWSTRGPTPDQFKLSFSASERFEREAVRFQMWIEATDPEKLAVEAVRNEIVGDIAAVLPTCDVRLHGSRTTGLEDSESDLNLVINPPVSDKDPKAVLMGGSTFKKRTLEVISAKLTDTGKYDQIEIVALPEVQLALRAHDSKTDLRVLLFAGTPTIHRTELTRNSISQHPEIKAIYLLLRQALRMRGLMGYGGTGITSYTLFIMVLTALEHAEVSGKTMNASPRLYDKLLGVLDFWTTQDLSKYLFSASPPARFPKFMNSIQAANVLPPFETSVSNEYLLGVSNICRANLGLKNRYERFGKRYKETEWHASYLSLLDPAKPTNDLGRHAPRIAHVIRVFRHIRQRLTNDARRWDQSLLLERPVLYMRTLDVLAYGYWHNYLGRRRRLHDYALELEPKGNQLPASPGFRNSEQQEETDSFGDSVEKMMNQRPQTVAAPPLSPSASEIKRLIDLDKKRP